MKKTLLSVFGVVAIAIAAVAQDTKTELATAMSELVVLKDGALVAYEPSISPEFYVVYRSASW